MNAMRHKRFPVVPLAAFAASVNAQATGGRRPQNGLFRADILSLKYFLESA
jgi:hypothetical protein